MKLNLAPLLACLSLLSCAAADPSPSDDDENLSSLEQPLFTAEGWAFVRTFSAGNSNFVLTDLSRNSSGGTNTMEVSGPGIYFVDLPGMDPQGGSVQVTAVGSTNRRCKVEAWFPMGSVMRVRVNCRDLAGAFAHSAFSMAFVQRRTPQTAGGPGGYLWGNELGFLLGQPLPPNHDYQWNSNGLENSVIRQGTGFYEQIWGGNFSGFFTGGPFGQANALGHDVTAYGSDDAYCKVGSVQRLTSAGEIVTQSRCFRANSVRVNAMYVSNTSYWLPYGGLDFVAGYANRPLETNPYTLGPGLYNATIGREDPVVSHPGLGFYQVRLPNGFPTLGSNVIVTAVGDAATMCNVMSWAGVSTGHVQLSVRCFSPAGIPADSAFHFTYTVG